MSSFLNASDILGTGIDALFDGNQTTLSIVPLNEIQVKKQIRQDFEDENNSLNELAESIKQRGVLQPILLRPSTNGMGYELVAGERRYRASKLAGLTTIPAHIKDMTDEEADDAQLAENIQRKNLTQIEEASKIQRDLNQLGSVEAVLKKHHKSRAWLSKILSLLDLPEQTKRLLSENISADMEVIHLVKMVEKHDSEMAKNLVNDLKNSRGQVDARAKAKAIKEQIKPSKKTFVSSHITKPKSLDRLIQYLYNEISSGNQTAQHLIDMLNADEVNYINNLFFPYFQKGQSEKLLSDYVAKQFHAQIFSDSEMGRLTLWAFLQGAEKRTEFDMVKLFSLLYPTSLE